MQTSIVAIEAKRAPKMNPKWSQKSYCFQFVCEKVALGNFQSHLGKTLIEALEINANQLKTHVKTEPKRSGLQ